MNFLSKLYYTLRDQGEHPLSGGRRIRAARDFILAQLAARRMPGEICVPFPGDCRLAIHPRMKGAAHFIYPGLYEFEEMAFVVHFLRGEDLFVDVGANIGAYTVLAAGAAGARTIAFEPSRQTFATLELNIRLNDLNDRVKLNNTAVGRKPGMVQMTEGLGTENSVREVSEHGETISVEMTALDIALKNEAPTLIKVDVEGFETEVFAGAAETLRNDSLTGLIIEKAGNASSYGFKEDDLHSRLREIGFLPCAYCPFNRSIAELPNEATGNIIYLRDLTSARKRVKEAKAFHYREFTI